MDDGITALFNRLCEIHIDPSINKPHLIQPELSKRDVRSKLKRGLYDTLFKQQKGLHSPTTTLNTDKELSTLNLKEKFYVLSYELRGKRRFDDADKLEESIDSLPVDENNDTTELCPTLRFLLALANIDATKTSPPVGHNDLMLPIKTKPSKDTFEVIPQGPLYFGDGKAVFNPNIPEYRYFPTELFTGADLNHPSKSREHIAELSQICDVLPGQDLLGNELFSVTSLTRSSHDSGHSSLFHGLTHSKVSSLDEQLGLPELPSHYDTRCLEFQIPKPVRSECSEDDEGFHESGSSISTIEVTQSVDVWKAALHYKPNRNYTWETIGKEPQPIERPYLTEAGSKVFDEIYKVRLKEFSNIEPELTSQPLNVISEEQLVNDSLNVMIGVPSQTFFYDETQQCFISRPGIHISGTSPESFQQVLHRFATMGTHYWTLNSFSRPNTLSSFYMGGLIFQAFAGDLQKYLCIYNSAVLSAPRGKEVTILLLHNLYQRWASQLRYLFELCMCDKRKGSKPGDRGDPFPTGINLLSYIYEQALDCINSDNYLLLLSLLRVSCGPYLMFIQDWTFNGICRDIYREFMIHVDDDYLHFRDKHYWTKGFILTTKDAEESVPMFLKDLAKDIFVCGKSINVLKLCFPEHHLCNSQVQIPRLSITFSLEELQRVQSRTRIYLTVMNQVSRLKSMSREEKAIRAELAKQQLLVRAKRTAAKELNRIKEEMKQERVAADAKKRRHFKELKEEMEKYLQRRGMEEEQEKEEDKKRVEDNLKKEQDERDQMEELEKQAKEELIDYYDQLSAEATLRERRALWKIKRRRLDDARYQFLQQDEIALRVALEEKKHFLEKALGLSKYREPSGGEEELGSQSEKPDGPGKSGMSGTGGTDDNDRPKSAILPGLPDMSSKDLYIPSPSKQSVEDRKRFEEESDSPKKFGDRNKNEKVEIDAPDRVTGPIMKDVGPSSAINADTQNSQYPDSQQKHFSESTRKHSANTSGQTELDKKSADNLIAMEDITLVEDGNVNENIEDALALVKEMPSARHILPANVKSDRKSPLNLIDLSISDFLPKESVPDSDESQTKTPRDSNLDEILIEIGSSLPTQALEKVTDSAGLDVLASHPSDSVAGNILYPGKDGATVGSDSVPTSNVHGHPSDSSLNVGVTHTDSASLRLPKANIHGHTSDDVAGSVIYSTDQKDERRPEPNVHGHTSDSVAGRVIYSTKGKAEARPASNIHGHPSASSISDGIVGVESLPKPRYSAHGHASDSSAGNVIYSEEGAKEKQPASNVHGHTSDSSAGNVIYSEEGAKEKQPASNVHGHASDSSAGGVIYSVQGSGEHRRPSANMHGHASDSVMSSVLYPDKKDQIAEYKKTKQLLRYLNKGEKGFESDEDNDLEGLPGLPLKSPDKYAKIPKDKLKTSYSETNIAQVASPEFPDVVFSDGHAPGKKLKRGVDAEDTLSPVVFVKEHRQLTGHPTDSSIQKMMYPEPDDNLLATKKMPSSVSEHNLRKAAGRPSHSKRYGGSKKPSLRSEEDVTSKVLDLGYRAKSLIYYGVEEDDVEDEDTLTLSTNKPIEVWVGDEVEPLQDNFDVLREFPSMDLLASAGIAPISTELGDYGLALAQDSDIKASRLYCLPVILKRSITASLSAQISLVNKSILDYYMVDLNIDKHFGALRHFLFLEDGEFGHRLCHQLFERLSQGARPGELLSPLSLNSILAKALQAAVYGETKYAENLSFALKWMPPMFKRNSIDALDCLELRYKVDWPVNIVITESSMMKYNKIFTFILQIKRASWVLRDVYFHLKRSALLNHAANSTQFRQLQLFRHEMQHFVHVIHGYMANQVVHVSWEEFQQELKGKVNNLDDLRYCHAEYLNKAIFRSLLNKKAEVVMNIITNILCLILKFRTQLISANWHYDPISRQAVHPTFQHMKDSFKAFKEFSTFLYKVVTKLVSRGYQPHLDDFLLRLNFNDFYDQQVNMATSKGVGQ
ncbi:gamma-tubulin complex component 6-like [Glandiceps talaboti]